MFEPYSFNLPPKQKILMHNYLTLIIYLHSTINNFSYLKKKKKQYINSKELIHSTFKLSKDFNEFIFNFYYLFIFNNKYFHFLFKFKKKLSNQLVCVCLYMYIYTHTHCSKKKNSKINNGTVHHR